MKSFYKIFILLFSITTIAGNAQRIQFLNAQNMHPIPMVHIKLEPGLQELTTDPSGILNISDNLEYSSIHCVHPDFESIFLSKEELAQNGFVVLLKSRTNLLDEVLVAATRTDRTRSDLSVQTLQLKRSEIDFQLPSTTADLLESTGSIMVQKSQQGGGSPVMRGFEANKILLVIDGVRMNNAIYRGGHLQNIITVDPLLLEKAELVFGPSSVIYGSDALGGVIHLITRNAQFRNQTNSMISGNALVKYATANQEKTTSLGLNIASGKWASYTGFGYSDFGDLRQGAVRDPFYGNWGKRLSYAERINGRDSMIVNDNPSIQKQSGYTQYNFLQKIAWKPTETTQHKLNIQWSSSTDIPRYDRLTETDGNGILRSAEWYYGPQDRLLIAYQLNKSANYKFFDEVQLIPAFQKIEESRHNRNFNSNNLNHRIEQVTIGSINLDFTKNWKRQIFQYGLESNYNGVKSTANRENIQSGAITGLDTRYPDGGSQTSHHGLYLSHQWKPIEQLIVHSGLRFNYYTLQSEFKDSSFFHLPFNNVEQKHTAFNGSFGIVYKPCNKFQLQANLSSGFRSPNVDDLVKVFESSAGRLIVPNPDLTPEQVVSLDLGIRKKSKKWRSFTLNGFYTWYQDVITVQSAQYKGQDSIDYLGTLSKVFTQANAGKAFIYGMNGALNLKLSNQWNFSSVLNYSFGRIKTDTTDYPLDHISPLTGKTALTWKHHKWNVEAAALYNGWKRLKNYNKVGEDNLIYASSYGSPSWTIINVNAKYALTEKLNIQVGLENILDSYYRVFSSGISGAGRNLVVACRYKI